MAIAISKTEDRRHSCHSGARQNQRSAAAAPVNVPVKVPVKVTATGIPDKILIIVRANPKATAQKMALALGVTDKTIKRHLKVLQEQGQLQRIGSDKAGHWEVVKKSR